MNFIRPPQYSEDRLRKSICRLLTNLRIEVRRL
jgi:hypothetical protein